MVHLVPGHEPCNTAQKTAAQATLAIGSISFYFSSLLCLQRSREILRRVLLSIIVKFAII